VKQAIIALHKEKRCHKASRSYPVKYGDDYDLMYYSETQKYIYSRSIDNPEPVTLADNTHEMVASTLQCQWLRSVPASPGDTIGTLGGGPNHHRILQDFGAPRLVAGRGHVFLESKLLFFSMLGSVSLDSK
jgi:hypothetical protein